MGQRYAHLSAEERGTIMAMRAHGASGREIARVLGRANSTITRELRRNGHEPRTSARGRPRLPYDATRAGERARRFRHKPRVIRKLHPHSAMWRRVKRMLARRWSPHTAAVVSAAVGQTRVTRDHLHRDLCHAPRSAAP